MKPLLLLDVDGVLLLRHDGDNRMRLIHGYIERDVVERVYELDGLFDIHWCTGWGHTANQVIGPIFGMEPKPVVELHMPQGWIPRPSYEGGTHDAAMNSRMNWKLGNVQQYLLDHQDRPVAWLDDQIGQTDVKRWAQARPKTKLVQTYEHRGLQEREMRVLADFAREHRLRR